MSNRVGDNLVHFGANEGLVRALRDEGAKFIVIGGLAVAWHCSERQADDMDLLVDPSDENSARVAAALRKLGFSNFSSDSFARPGLQVPLKGSYYAELLTPAPDSSDFSTLEEQAVNARLFGIPVRLASISTLIAMKRHAALVDPAQSEKHLRDIGLLGANAART